MLATLFRTIHKVGTVLKGQGGAGGDGSASGSEGNAAAAAMRDFDPMPLSALPRLGGGAGVETHHV